MSGDREFKQPALASWERLQAERDEWKARAEKAVTERDAWIRLFNRLEAAVGHHKKVHGVFSTEADEALWKARAKVLKAAAGRETEPDASERDRLQEQVEQAREILHDLFTNAAIDGRNNWQPVEAFLRAYPVASASGSPDTETT